MDPTPLPEHIKGVQLEEIISGTRCSPLTMKEFEGFLIHEEHSVENLQFIVWYRSYCERFNALPAEYQQLSPPPTSRFSLFPTSQGGTAANSIRTGGGGGASIKTTGTGIEKWWKIISESKWVNGKAEEKGWSGENPEDDNISLRSAVNGTTVPLTEPAFPTTGRPLSLLASKDGSAAPREAPQGTTSTMQPNPLETIGLPLTSTINTDAADSRSISTEAPDTLSKKLGIRFPGLNTILSRSSAEKILPPHTPLPFLPEIELVLTTFLLPGSTRELNIDSRLRKHVLKSLRHSETGTPGEREVVVTTHPEVFRLVAECCFEMMENSLPRYLQWAKGNTNTPKSLFWFGVGFLDMGIGLMIGLITIFFARSRWWRIFSFLFFQFGVMQSYSASRYFCSQVHGRSARQLYPWELTEELSNHTGSDVDMSQTAENHTSSAEIPSGKVSYSLASSLPFLFNSSSSKNTTGLTNEKGGKVEASGIKGGKGGQAKRSKWWAGLKKDDGKKVPIFGPERVVEDPYIQYIHNQQIKEILWVGFGVTFLFLVIMLAIPEQRPR